jgi:CheY-like chemotaxis protein
MYVKKELTMNILIVEDNPISATVIEHTLDKHGYETLTAHDGEEALGYLESHPEIELIITDLVMPNTDGVELVRRIKERKEWNAIPILVCTSMRPENANERLAGQDWKFVLKPIKSETLLQKVAEVTAQQRKVLQDPAITMTQIGIDPEAFDEVVDKFSETVNEKIIRLEQQGDKDTVDPLDLKDLLEGAKLVRADRLTDVLTSLENGRDGCHQEIIRASAPLLLRELKAMQYHLNLFTA